MARIRSIHPGIWTDEDFAAVSMAARILYLGILTEADDHGVFEWKPVGLKMRIFPADKIDVEPLLTELLGVDKISFIPNSDSKLGLVRNFCKFQRPKKPTYKYLLPDECRTYVGLTDGGTVPVPNQFSTGTEKSPQMEEEGGNRNKEEDTANAVPSSATTYAFEDGIIRLSEKDFNKWKANFSHLDLRAELTGLAEWANQQGDRWFFAVAGALTKRNRAVKTTQDKPRRTPADQDWKEALI